MTIWGPFRENITDKRNYLIAEIEQDKIKNLMTASHLNKLNDMGIAT